MSELSESQVYSPLVTAALYPQPLQNVQLSISEKQNFAMVAEEIFSKAIDNTMWDYRKDYTPVYLILNEIKNTAMESIATEAGVTRLADLVFRNEVTRSIVFLIQMRFICQFSEFDAFWTDLITTTAMALTHNVSPTGIPIGVSLVPDEIRERMYDMEKMRDLMLSNTWLVTVIFIILWGRIHSYDELRAKQRGS